MPENTGLSGFGRSWKTGADKLEVVVTFLAILELMKIGKIHLTQEHLFDDMEIENAGA